VMRLFGQPQMGLGERDQAILMLNFQ